MVGFVTGRLLTGIHRQCVRRSACRHEDLGLDYSRVEAAKEQVRVLGRQKFDCLDLGQFRAHVAGEADDLLRRKANGPGVHRQHRRAGGMGRGNEDFGRDHDGFDVGLQVQPSACAVASMLEQESNLVVLPVAVERGFDDGRRG